MVGYLRSLDRNLLTLGGIALAVIFFLSLNVLSNVLLKSVRLDLTEDSMFTLTEGTKEILASVDEPIVLRFYRSKKLEEFGPFYANHGDRVRELLEDYTRLSGGKVRIERYDPQPFSPEEDLAVADGLRGITIDATSPQVFFGIAGHNSTDDTSVIPYLAPDRASFLEYDLTRLVYDLVKPDKPVVAVIGDLPMRGSQANRFQPWRVFESMQRFFDLRVLSGAPEMIDADAQILLLAQPASVDEKALYAIDQFVMRGGKVLAFIDPFSEFLTTANPRGTPGASAIAPMEPLLAAWGVEIAKDKVVGDRKAATRVRAMRDGRQIVTAYLPWLSLTRETFAKEDIITANLKTLNIRDGGSIRAREGATTTIEPLVSSSTEAMEIDLASVLFAPDPVRLLNDFKASGQAFTLAARVTGPVKSAFPDGPPEAIEDEDVRAAHLAEAVAPLSMVIVADSDFLTDRNWVQVQQLLGQQFSVPFANNGDFTINALDNLGGSRALIGLRGRGLIARPFEVIEEMTREAEAKFRAKERALRKNIDETQEKIRRIQKEEEQAGIIVSAEQQETIEKFRFEMVELRGELREVQHALNQDVERLATWIRALNIWAVPLIVALFALILALLKRRRAISYQAALRSG